MSVATEARRILERLPPDVRTGLEQAVAFVPRRWLYGRQFRATRALIDDVARMSAVQLQEFTDRRLRELIEWAYTRVPYYQRVMRERGLRPDHVRRVAELSNLPLLTKDLVREHADELLARGPDVPARERTASGGTTGTPVHFWIDRQRSAFEWAFVTRQWESAGYTLGDRRAILRGATIRGAANGRIHEWHPLLDELVLSTFQLSPNTLPVFLTAFERYKPAFLHAFPSSAEHLARLLQSVPEHRRPQFRALLLSSENLYPAQRQLLESFYGCRAFAFYGHSEKCLIGAGCAHSNEYHMNPAYGALEVLGDDGRAVGPGGTGTIVGTSFMNRVMPFIRYATDDCGTVAEGACACGSGWPRLARIDGRNPDEILYGSAGRVYTMSALNTHSAVLERVLRFQIRQDRPGSAVILVVPAPAFQQSDALAISSEFGNRSANTIEFSVQTVDDLPLTKRGKFRYVDQRWKRPAG